MRQNERLKILDSFFNKNNARWTTKELMDKFNAHVALGDQVHSLNTIRQDRDMLAETFHVQLIEERDGKNIYYRYEEPHPAPLNADDRKLIENAKTIMRRLAGMPDFGWTEEAGWHLSSYGDEQPIVGFERNERVKGMQHMAALIKHIRDKQAIVLHYQPFGKDLQDITLSPYYIKQSRNRWYLLGYVEGETWLGTFPLDRIKSFETSPAPFHENDKFDFDAYFDDIIGITHPKDGIRQTVRMWVTDSQYKYMATKPIHKSQVARRTEDGIIIELNVVPNYELEEFILSKGEDVKVLEPEDLRKRIQQRIKAMVLRYE